MSKEYRYRKSWKSLVTVTVVILSVLWSLLLSTHFFKLGKVTAYSSTFLVTMVIGVGPLLGVILLLIIDYIRRTGISVSIGDDAIIYKNRRREKKILFSAITNLKFSLWKTESVIKIISENDTIPLSIELQNSSNFLQELKNVIAQKVLSISYDQKKFFSFFKKAVYSDQSWARMDSISWRLTVIAILSGILGIVCAILSLFGSVWFGIGVILWITLSMVLPIIGYSCAEDIFARRLIKQIDEQSFTYPSRDIAYEKTIYRKVLIFGALIYIIFSIAATFILRSTGV